MEGLDTLIPDNKEYYYHDFWNTEVRMAYAQRITFQGETPLGNLLTGIRTVERELQELTRDYETFVFNPEALVNPAFDAGLAQAIVMGARAPNEQYDFSKDDNKPLFHAWATKEFLEYIIANPQTRSRTIFLAMAQDQTRQESVYTLLASSQATGGVSCIWEKKRALLEQPAFLHAKTGCARRQNL